MSVSQRILKREVSYRHVRGKGETSVELLEEILSNQNMNRAYKRVYRNKGASGVDGVTVEEIKDYVNQNWKNIKSQIKTRNYRPQPVSTSTASRNSQRKRENAQIGHPNGCRPSGTTSNQSKIESNL